MNKNKIIFSIIWALVLIFFIVVFFVLSSLWNKNSSKTQADNKKFTIWVLGDSQEKFQEFLKTFKQSSEKYKKTEFRVISFSSYDEYYNSLISSFLWENSPDIFVLNNNEWAIFDKQILWVRPEIASPDDFRKNYEQVFSNDLIKNSELDGKKVEFLKWIPLWYEVLWLFYNFRDLRWKKLDNWSYVNEAIRELRESSWVSWIWIWNWTTVYEVSDIITQFFLLEWIDKLSSLNWNSLKSALSSYFRFWDVKMDNRYDSFYQDLISTNKNNLDLFSKWDIQMVIWYPRMLEEIDKKWFSKNFLRVNNFPSYSATNNKMLVDYNYFVINKNTKDLDLSLELMKYFSTQEWQKKYLEIFNYYLPSNINLLKTRLEENIMPWYSVKYKDFYNSSFELTSFDKKNRSSYDSQVPQILDKSFNWIEIFENFAKTLLCTSNKMINQEWLEKSCK